MLSFRPLDSFVAPAAGRLFLAIVLLAMGSGRVLAQPMGDRPMLLTSPASVEQLERGRNDLFRLDLRAADRTFRDLARTRDGAPAAYYHLALSSLIDALLTDSPAAYDRFFGHSDSLRIVLEKAGKGPWRDLLEAETDAQRSFVWAKRGQYVRAAMAGTSSFRRYREIEERHPALADARKGIGIFEAMIGARPEFVRRFLTVFGYPGDFERGTDNLLTAARGGGYFADEASLYLGLLGLFEYPVPVDPMSEMEGIYRRRGQSPVIALPYLELLFKVHDVAAADAVLAEMRRRRQAGTLVQVDLFTFFEGESAFRRNRFDEAARLFGRYLADHEGTARKATVWLRLGMANDQLGRRTEAIEAYHQVMVAREYDSDDALVRQAERLVAAPPSGRERDLVRAANAFDRNDLVEADSALTALRAAADMPEALRAEVQYRSGRVSETRGEIADAIGYYRAATRQGGDPRGRWIPTSWFRIGILEAERGRKTEAVAALERVLAHPGEYDYRWELRQQAAIRLESLK